MPNPTPSQYEADRLQQQNEARRNSERQRTIRAFRDQVEAAIDLDARAGGLERRIVAYDGDLDGFRQRVLADRADWKMVWIFWGAILFLPLMEFLSSGDIADVLAYNMAPHFGFDPATGGMSIWLRRVAGAGFIGSMLVATLLTKLATTWFSGVFKRARSSLMAGEDLRYWCLTCGIWGMHFARVAYIVAAASLYLWLFGFAQERAAIMADFAVEQKQAAEWTDLGIRIEGGAIEADEAGAPKAENAEAAASTTRLAGATGVFYAVIVLLHALVLLLPTNGFARELELARFRRGPAEARATALRGEEGHVLREIYERIRTAPNGYQQDFIAAAEPVIPSIIKLYKRDVIRLPENAQNPVSTTSDAVQERVPQSPPDSPTQPFGPNGNGATVAGYHQGIHSDPDDSPSDEAPPADWETIFPTARRV
ncbi:MAG TPA: hypothetical protein PLU30_00280 [Verrucomicrobiae bacterium]|nr:hypothetical protein [Verrucomicrobiae bacterium]